MPMIVFNEAIGEGFEREGLEVMVVRVMVTVFRRIFIDRSLN